MAVQKKNESYYCPKCRRTLKASEFYLTNNLEKYPTGHYTECKKCMTMHVDNWDPSTYTWILQELDVPYLPDVWRKTMSKYANDPDKLTGLTILGHYLSTMKLKQHKEYRWKDTEKLQKEYQ